MELPLGGAVVAHLLPFLAVIAITIASLIDRSGTLKEEKSVSILLVTFLHCLASFLVLAPLAVGLEGLEANWNGSLVFAIVWLAIVVSLAAYGLMFVLLRRLPASQVASLTYLSPPVTMIMAMDGVRRSSFHVGHLRTGYRRGGCFLNAHCQ